MNVGPKEIGIATTTYYPNWYEGICKNLAHTDKVRGDLALTFIALARQREFSIAVVDGESNEGFQKALHKIPGVMIRMREKIQRSPARRMAIQTVAHKPDIKAILLTEPEKISLLEDCLEQLIMPIVQEDVAFVFPKRKKRLFIATYPRFQYESEVQANLFFNQKLRQYHLLKIHEDDIDAFFGPSIFANNRQVIAAYMYCFQMQETTSIIPKEYIDPEEFGDTLFFPIVFALRKKLKTKNITIPFSYPKEQKLNEEYYAKKEFIEKRQRQAGGVLFQLDELLLYLNGRKSKLVTCKEK